VLDTTAGKLEHDTKTQHNCKARESKDEKTRT